MPVLSTLGSPLSFPSSPVGHSLPKAGALGTANPRSLAELAQYLCGITVDWEGAAEKLDPWLFLFHLLLAAKLANEREAE